jgi:hypothetical protein
MDIRIIVLMFAMICFIAHGCHKADRTTTSDVRKAYEEEAKVYTKRSSEHICKAGPFLDWLVNGELHSKTNHMDVRKSPMNSDELEWLIVKNYGRATNYKRLRKVGVMTNKGTMTVTIVDDEVVRIQIMCYLASTFNNEKRIDRFNDLALTIEKHLMQDSDDAFVTWGEAILHDYLTYDPRTDVKKKVFPSYVGVITWWHEPRANSLYQYDLNLTSLKLNNQINPHKI